MRGLTEVVALPGLVAAEAVKLRTLPAAVWTSAGTMLAAVSLAAAVASSSPEGTDPTQVLARVVPLLQAGTILLGALAAGSEYAGRQLRTSLAAAPRRGELLAAKTLAASGALALTTVPAVLGGVLVAEATLTVRYGEAGLEAGPAVGAAAHLVAMGLLGLVLAVLLRSVVPALVTMLAVTLILSPLLAGRTEHARWLPDRAGSLLYASAPDAVLTPAAGGLVLLGWLVLGYLAATFAFHRRGS